MTTSPAVLFGKPTVAISQVGGPDLEPTMVAVMQHQLPKDERPDRRLALLSAPDSERAASFRVLRHHLLEAGRPRCIVVSSARPREGKTTTALNLAHALAECRRAKVLLVEANIGRPQLAGVFKFLPPRCFLAQLNKHRDEPALPWTLVENPDVGLHIGAIDPRLDRNQLLDGTAFGIGMDRLRNAGYDHIVIDGPATLGSADVNLLADAADCVVLAVRARHTTARDVRMAIDQVGAQRVAGAVIIES